MGSPLERRRSGGRRVSDSRDTRALRGLLHDLGHQMSTLSFLVEAVRGDLELPEDASYRLELLSLEMTRLLDIIREGLQAGDAPPEPVRTREVAVQLARLAQLAYQADVVLLPGPEATAVINPVLLWRMLSNVVDNAARAAGPDGRVTLAIRHERSAAGGCGGSSPRGNAAGGCGESSPRGNAADGCGGSSPRGNAAGGPRGSTVVEVTDDGPGFGSAPRGQASLGLDVVTALLVSSGGTLEVVSPPAGGTTVRMTIPGEAVAPRQAPAPADRTAPAAPAARADEATRSGR
jgi:signal transduction histidine kinase